MGLKKNIAQMQSNIRDEIYAINRGGCIHFAYYFSKRLHELKIPHKITFLYDDYMFSTKISEFESATHVLVYIPEIGYVDGETTYDKSELRGSHYHYRNRKTVKLSVKTLNLFRNTPHWNPTYSKHQNNNLKDIIYSHIV